MKTQFKTVIMFLFLVLSASFATAVDIPPLVTLSTSTTSTTTTATLTATATDLDTAPTVKDITSLVLYRDGAPYKSSTCSGVAATCILAWVEVISAPAIHTYIASGTDNEGHTVASTPVTITFAGIDYPPVLSGMPADITEEAESPTGNVVTYATPTATDAIDGSVPVTCLPASDSTFVIGTTTVTCSATDSGGNTVTDTFDITIEDTTDPIITVPSDITVEATSPAGAVVSYVTSATDIADASPAIVCDTPSGSTFPLGDTTVSCTATDAAGNTDTDDFVVTVEDTTDPTFIGTPADFTVEADSPAGATVTYTDPTATDIADASVAVSCAPASGSVFGFGPTLVTCTATDDSGNDATSTFTVTVVDTTAPIVTVPADIVAEATNATGAVVTYAASATDAVDGSPAVTCVPPSGSTFALDVTTTVTCDSTDTNGNTGSATFTITVNDTTAPVVTVPADITVEATSSAGAVVTYSSSASDAVDGSPAVSCDFPSGTTFALGTTLVTCSSTDAHSNTGSDTFNVIVEDTTGPVFSPSTMPDITAEPTSPAGAVVTYTDPTATDAVAGPVAVSCVPPSGSTFPLGETTVTCSATDGTNSNSLSFNVTIADTTPPVISGTPADFTIEATSSAGAIGSYVDPTATDAFDGPVAVSCSPVSGSTFTLGATLVTCTATDSASNSASTNFTITVVDTTAPTLLGMPLDFTVEATSSAGAVATYTDPTATDLVDASPDVSCAPVSGSTFALGATLVTCTATDDFLNTDTDTFTITVTDTTAPVVTVPADIVAEATNATGAVVPYATSATDAVDGTPAVSCDFPSGSTFLLDVTTLVTCSSTDAASNTGTASFNITVNDTTPAIITIIGGDVSLTTGDTYTDAGATAMDAVDGDLTSFILTASTVATGTPGTYTVTYNVTDAHSNFASAIRTVTVSDPAPAPSGGGGGGGGGGSSGGSRTSYNATIVPPAPLTFPFVPDETTSGGSSSTGSSATGSGTNTTVTKPLTGITGAATAEVATPFTLEQKIGYTIILGILVFGLLIYFVVRKIFE